MHSMSMYVGCTWNGVQYEEGATWTDAGQTCSCVGGRVTCRTDDCPKLTPAPCPQDSPGKRKKRNMKDREKNTEALFQTQMGCLCVYIHRLVCYLVNKAITTAMVKVLSIQFRFRNELILYLFSGLTFMGGYIFWPLLQLDLLTTFTILYVLTIKIPSTNIYKTKCIIKPRRE